MSLVITQVKFVLAKNVQRRQKELTLGQRVIIVLEANEWESRGGDRKSINVAPATLITKSASEMAEEVGTTILKDCNSNEFRCVNPISKTPSK